MHTNDNSCLELSQSELKRCRKVECVRAFKILSKTPLFRQGGEKKKGSAWQVVCTSPKGVKVMGRLQNNMTAPIKPPQQSRKVPVMLRGANAFLVAATVAKILKKFLPHVYYTYVLGMSVRMDVCVNWQHNAMLHAYL